MSSNVETVHVRNQVDASGFRGSAELPVTVVEDVIGFAWDVNRVSVERGEIVRDEDVFGEFRVRVVGFGDGEEEPDVKIHPFTGDSVFVRVSYLEQALEVST